MAETYRILNKIKEFSDRPVTSSFYTGHTYHRKYDIVVAVETKANLQISEDKFDDFTVKDRKLSTGTNELELMI